MIGFTVELNDLIWNQKNQSQKTLLIIAYVVTKTKLRHTERKESETQEK